ncbi:unnamed protein product [Vitrella brassicaformis CCMP3155]|uniref:Senescence domain-containing protein n=1 Tax=Vitrella brassicaformis (strain CCMP3155) TaxID=1169540 RepID=A0A0G4GLE5_VITBC|nr:unnamed protein product [Vitrella brassicaformis CCMP3155]|mmetsp:Transcript_31777/g.78792  ORF Transcript_31777/g.78792 Transcript_31777/m.78792 type:complete len:96 (+) Transcript_31777:169-456(+)|eukprot:CEM30934.1 unnamed protein product [Vitrella brassicaformis CCMP3155]
MAEEDSGPRRRRRRNEEDLDNPLWAMTKTAVKGTVDTAAFIGKGFMTVARGIGYAVQEAAYPVKECIVTSYDRADRHVNPYKARGPQAPVPQFEY